MRLLKKVILTAVALLMSVVLFAGCQAEKGGSAKGKSEKVQITVSAAASLKDVLAELSSVYEKDHPNVSIKFNFGSSGALQQQIEQGAPADLFFSAAEDKFNRVVNQGLIDKKDSVKLVENSLVLIVPKGKISMSTASKIWRRAKLKNLRSANPNQCQPENTQKKR